MSLVSIKELFQAHYDTQDTNTFEIFQVPIKNSKRMEKFNFHNDASMLKYCQKSLSSCCFIILESAFSSIKKTKAANDISFSIYKNT